PGRPARAHHLRRVRAVPAAAVRVPEGRGAPAGRARAHGQGHAGVPATGAPAACLRSGDQEAARRGHLGRMAGACGGRPRDLVKFLRGVTSRDTLAAAEALPRFGKPALVVWTPEDPSFPLSLGERLAKALPAARLELIADAHVFVSEDQPERLAALIDAFVGGASARPAA